MAEPGKLSILLCEDDEMALKVLTRVISRICPNCTVYSATNGKTGLECFRQHQPDIVITDIKMPIMDGIEMTRQMKAVKPDFKTIVITASGQRRLEESAARDLTAVDHYCTKPLTYQELVDAIEQCVGCLTAERGTGG